MNLSIYMYVRSCMKCFIYWTADVKSSKLWSSQLRRHFMQLRMWKPEKFRTATGFEPVTSWYQCDALTHWAMKPLTLGAGQLWILRSPWGMNVRIIAYLISHPQFNIWSISYITSHSFLTGSLESTVDLLPNSIDGLQESPNPVSAA